VKMVDMKLLSDKSRVLFERQILVGYAI
jgi:hypothetical protein